MQERIIFAPVFLLLLMLKKSAGILLYRKLNDEYEFFLVHPGGPFFKNKDDGVWSIPKGECNDNEDLYATALREFEEETGFRITPEQAIRLNPVKQNSKIVYSWAVQKDVNPEEIKSNTFELEFPPKTGKKISIPEVDRASWFNSETAKQKIIPAQFAIINELLKILRAE